MNCASICDSPAVVIWRGFSYCEDCQSMIDELDVSQSLPPEKEQLLLFIVSDPANWWDAYALGSIATIFEGADTDRIRVLAHIEAWKALNPELSPSFELAVVN